MRVHGCVTGCTGQILVLTVRDVLLRLGVAVLLGETKIDAMDLVRLLADADEEIIRLDIAMDEILGVDVFDTVDHLIRQHQHGLERELAIAEVEQILKRRSQKIDNHHVVIALDTIPMNVRNANTAREDLVELGLVQQLRMLRLDTLKLDGDLC